MHHWTNAANTAGDNRRFIKIPTNQNTLNQPRAFGGHKFGGFDIATQNLGHKISVAFHFADVIYLNFHSKKRGFIKIGRLIIIEKLKLDIRA
jgi:hypothetical protein